MLAVLLLWLAVPGTASGGASGEAPAYDLVGCGVRSIFFQRAYALTLFEDGEGGEVIVLDVLHEGGMPGGLPDDWYPRLRETLGEDVIARIDGAFGLIGPGSRVEIAYRPGPDLSAMRVDGEAAFAEPGPDAFEAVYDRWFGADPISRSLKRDVLEGECEAG